MNRKSKPSLIKMKERIKFLTAIIWQIFKAVNVKPGLRFNYNFTIPILNYHSISPDRSSSAFRISPEIFEKQILHLTSNYNVIPLHVLIESKATGNMPENPAVVTFDDGYKDNYVYGFPILKQYNCPAIIFIPTAFIENEIGLFEGERLLPLTWEQIIEMKSSNLVFFGSHGHTHRSLGLLPLNEVYLEIGKSKEILESRLNEKITLFAYPNGQPKDFNRKIIEILKEAGFIAACSTVWNTENSYNKLFYLNRVLIESNDDIKIFDLKLKGGYDYIHFINKARSYFQRGEE